MKLGLNFVKIGDMSTILHGVDVFLPLSLSSFEISGNTSDFRCLVYSFRPVWMQVSTVDACVGIATRYGLDSPGIESRWGKMFRTLPGLLYIGYQVFPGGKAACVWR